MTDATAEATFDDFVAQDAAKRRHKTIVNSWTRAALSAAAGLIMTYFFLQGGVENTLIGISLWLFAFLCVLGHTPRILQTRSLGPHIPDNASPSYALALQQGARAKADQSPHQNRQLQISHLVRGLIAVALLAPLPVLKIMENHAHYERYGMTGAVVVSHDADGNEVVRPLVRGTMPPSYIAPQSKWDRWFNRTVEIRPEPAQMPAQTLAQTPAPATAPPTPTPIGPTSAPARVSKFTEHLVRHTDRRFYGVGP